MTCEQNTKVELDLLAGLDQRQSLVDWMVGTVVLRAKQRGHAAAGDQAGRMPYMAWICQTSPQASLPAASSCWICSRPK